VHIIKPEAVWRKTADIDCCLAVLAGLRAYPLIDNAKVMAKGQITLPKDIRTIFRVGTGDRVTLICEGDRLILMNSMVYAMKVLQNGIAGEAEKAGLRSEEDVDRLIAEMRAEERVSTEAIL
jgi:AbrB family looped-hinge helix DNA binding protein